MEFVALACQILRTLGKVNQGQWAFMQEIVQCFDARNNMREWPAILLEGPPGTGKTTTISKLLSLLYHNTPAYRNLTPNGRRRSPSLRSLICTASNAGLDQILSSFVKEGIATLNFDEITGMRQARQSGSSNGFEDALMTLFDKVEKGKVTYESMFGSRTIRAPNNHVDSLDEDVESDIRVLRLGRTDNEVARSFTLMQGRSPGMEDEDFFTEAHGTGFLAAPASALAAIREADILFTTCSTSGSNLMQHNPGPFDLILIDESAQATEPEALIPLSAHFGPNTVLVLVGDTHQLGPVVKSQVPSTRTILGTSILERLSASRRESIVSLRLNVQYRMHEDIASFISRRFYGCGLSSDISRRRAKDLHLLGARVSAVCVDTSSFCGNSLTSLQVSRCKNIFFEKSVGSSFTNIGESILVAKIIRSVLFENGELRPSDIAVITPYAAQKIVIRDHIVEIEGKQSLNIEVDTMDAFQGSERSVVIIDLVRSQGNTIGFIGDERRSNVALSRAKDLLIVVGNMSTMLSNSPNPWLEWKNHCTSLHISNVISDETRLSKLWRLDSSTSKQ
jgi:superfamily I DNA and/or RNA helicase